MNVMKMPSTDIEQLLRGDIDEVFLSLNPQFESPFTPEVMGKISKAYFEQVKVDYTVDFYLSVMSANAKFTYKLKTFTTSAAYDFDFVNEVRYYKSLCMNSLTRRGPEPTRNPEYEALRKINSARVDEHELKIFLQPLFDALRANGYTINSDQIASFTNSREGKITLKKFPHSDVIELKPEVVLRIRIAKIQKCYIDLITKNSLPPKGVDIIDKLSGHNSVSFSAGYEQLEGDKYMIAYIGIFPEGNGSPYKVAYFGGVPNGFVDRLSSDEAVNRKSNVLLTILSRLKTSFPYNEEDASDFIDGKTKILTISKKPAINIHDERGRMDPDQLFSSHVSSNVENVVLKFEPGMCFVLLSDATFYCINLADSPYSYLMKAYRWLSEEGFRLPENVLQKYIGKGDYSSPLYFKRK